MRDQGQIERSRRKIHLAIVTEQPSSHILQYPGQIPEKKFNKGISSIWGVGNVPGTSGL